MFDTAEGYAAGELKHGPIALVNEEMPVVVVAPSNPLMEKTLSNMHEVAARGGKIILITDATGRQEAGEDAGEIIEMPRVNSFVAPIVSAIPVQILAYHTAVQVRARSRELCSSANLSNRFIDSSSRPR